jgi:ankyrin repeat protein
MLDCRSLDHPKSAHAKARRISAASHSLLLGVFAPLREPPVPRQNASNAGTVVVIFGIMKANFILSLALALSALAWSSVAPQARGGEIHEAAKAGDLEKFKALVEEIPELVCAKDNRGMTPLHFAAENGSKRIVELLLAKGAEVNVRDSDGRTALELVAANSRSKRDIAKLLLDNKADVNIKDNVGRTALHYAAAHGSKEVVELLLTTNADINAKGYHNLTPLHYATMNGRIDIVELLLTKGVEVNATTKVSGYTPLDGKTPLAFANEGFNKALNAAKVDKEVIGKWRNLLQLLRKHGAKE